MYEIRRRKYFGEISKFEREVKLQIPRKNLDCKNSDKELD